MPDDLEEIKLECDHAGSHANRVRYGRKNMRYKVIGTNIPKWRLQLRGYRAGKGPRRNSRVKE